MRREIVRLCALLLALCWLVGPALAAPLEAEPPLELTSPSAMPVSYTHLTLPTICSV